MIQPGPAAGLPAGRSHWLLLAAQVALYLAFFVLYYPPTHGIEDEVGFINEAIVLSRGAVTAGGAGYDTLGDFRPYRGRLVGIRNPGRPILTAPFIAAAGPESVFAAGALIHVALAVVAGLVFVRLGMSPMWAGLVLWHPTLSLYSRTVMGDTGAALCLILALLGLMSSRHPGLRAGLAVGCAAIMRYQAGIVLPFLALAILADPIVPRRRREAAACLAAGLAVGALIVAWNLYLYGSPTGIVKGEFGLRFLPDNMLFYGSALLMVWPLMLLAPLFDHGRLRLAAAAVYAPPLLFFLFYYFHDSGPGWIQTIVIGQRLIQIAIPALIVSYAVGLDTRLLSRLRGSRAGRLVPAALGACLLLAASFNGVMFARHQRHLEGLVGVRDEIVATIPPDSLIIVNSVAAKILDVPLPGVPIYRTHRFDPATLDQTTAAGTGDWYFVVLARHDSAVVDEDDLRAAVARHACVRLATDAPGLTVHRCPGAGETVAR